MLVSLIAIKVKTDTGWFKLPTLKGSPGFSAYEVWINEGNTGTITDYLNSLKGADGADGAPGIQGPQGPQGISGNTFQFIYTNTTENVAPTTPTTSQSDTAPIGWSIYPVGITESNKYQWVSTRIKTNGIWGNYTTPTLWAIYSTGGDSSPYILPQATNLILGGIKATARTTETTPVVIDTSTGFLYTSASGTGGGIEDVPLDTVTPKLYGRYSGNQSWQEILPEQGSVGTLQQVTTNGATSDKLITLSGGLKLSTLLQLPDTDPTELLDEGKYGLYVSDTGISGELPTSGGDYILPKASATVLGGIKVGSNLSINSEGVLSAIGTGGTTDHSLLSNRTAANSHPTSAITGLDTALQNFSEDLSIVSNAINSKLDNSHASSSEAHSTLFANKANLNGDITKDFSVKNLTAAEKVTMLENVNTNLRIPQAAPTNPVEGQTYLYIE